jgi:hypothetical protein
MIPDTDISSVLQSWVEVDVWDVREGKSDARAFMDTDVCLPRVLVRVPWHQDRYDREWWHAIPKTWWNRDVGLRWVLDSMFPQVVYKGVDHGPATAALRSALCAVAQTLYMHPSTHAHVPDRHAALGGYVRMAEKLYGSDVCNVPSVGEMVKRHAGVEHPLVLQWMVVQAAWEMPEDVANAVNGEGVWEWLMTYAHEARTRACASKLKSSWHAVVRLLRDTSIELRQTLMQTLFRNASAQLGRAVDQVLHDPEHVSVMRPYAAKRLWGRAPWRSWSERSSMLMHAAWMQDKLNPMVWPYASSRRLDMDPPLHIVLPSTRHGRIARAAHLMFASAYPTMVWTHEDVSRRVKDTVLSWTMQDGWPTDAVARMHSGMSDMTKHHHHHQSPHAWSAWEHVWGMYAKHIAMHTREGEVFNPERAIPSFVRDMAWQAWVRGRGSLPVRERDGWSWRTFDPSKGVAPRADVQHRLASIPFHAASIPAPDVAWGTDDAGASSMWAGAGPTRAMAKNYAARRGSHTSLLTWSMEEQLQHWSVHAASWSDAVRGDMTVGLAHTLASRAYHDHVAALAKRSCVMLTLPQGVGAGVLNPVASTSPTAVGTLLTLRDARDAWTALREDVARYRVTMWRRLMLGVSHVEREWAEEGANVLDRMLNQDRRADGGDDDEADWSAAQVLRATKIADEAERDPWVGPAEAGGFPHTDGVALWSPQDTDATLQALLLRLPRTETGAARSVAAAVDRVRSLRAAVVDFEEAANVGSRRTHEAIMRAAVRGTWTSTHVTVPLMEGVEEPEGASHWTWRVLLKELLREWEVPVSYDMDESQQAYAFIEGARAWGEDVDRDMPEYDKDEGVSAEGDTSNRPERWNWEMRRPLTARFLRRLVLLHTCAVLLHRTDGLKLLQDWSTMAETTHPTAIRAFSRAIGPGSRTDIADSLMNLVPSLTCARSTPVPKSSADHLGLDVWFVEQARAWDQCLRHKF